MTREDVLEGGHAPSETKSFLRRIGGKNPFGEDNFRLTLAEKTLIYQGAVWAEWPKNSRPSERGALVESPVTGQYELVTKPLRHVAEMRWVQRYPQMKGWILQEWEPASMYGSPQEWYSYSVPDHPDLCRLGPYPSHGDYELAAPNAWPSELGVPTHTALENAVRFLLKNRELWHAMTKTARRSFRENQYLEAQALKERRARQAQMDRMKEATSGLFNVSLAAGRWREELAKSAGIRSHVGN